MRPLFLEFEGLFSYRSKVSIDFQKLTDAGIFGIFGNTGSGKSAILDAITLALYGDVDRITNKIEKVVNLDKRNANVVFEFQTGNDTDTKYRAELSIRLAEVRTISTKRSILKKIQGEVETIVSEKIGTIIGLEFKNFTLSSIIPQGKFAEFLDSTSINKTNILKSIFNLEKFDLGKKINSITKETEIELESINQRLDGLKSFTPEILENTKRDLAETTTQKLKLNYEIEKLGALLNELKNLKEMHEQKTALETKLRELDSNKPEIDKLRQELEAYEKLYKLFKNDFDNKKLTGNEINSVNTQLVKSNSELESIQNEFNFAEKEFEKISKEYSVKDEIIRKRDNLTKVLQIFNLENKLKEFEDSKNRIKVIQEKLVSSLQKLEKEISALESTKTEKELLLIDTGSLTELKNSLLNNDKLQKEIKDFDNELTVLEAEKETNLKSISNVIQSIAAQDKTGVFLIDKEINSQTLKIINDKKIGINEVEDSLHKLRINSELHRYSQNLATGEKCPLCGSTEHPEPANFESNQQEVLRLQNEIETIKTGIDDLNKYLNDFLLLEQKLKGNDSQIENLNKKRNAKNEEFQQNLFDISKPENVGKTLQEIEILIQQNKAVQNEIEKIGKLIIDQKKSLALNKKKTEDSTSNLRTAESEVIRLSSEIQTRINECGEEIYHSSKGRSVSEIELEINSLSVQYDKIQSDYDALSRKIKNLTQTKGELTGKVTSLKAQLDNLNEKKEEIQNNIDGKLNSGNYNSEEEVLEILKKELDSDAINRKIEEFKNEFDKNNTLLNEVLTKINDRNYEEGEYEQKSRDYSEKKELSAGLSTKEGELNETIKNIEKGIVEAKELKKLSDTMDKRLGLLKDLSKLFHGGKFVKFVANHFLNSIILSANEKFKRMTNSGLELKLEGENIMIVDNFHDGKIRDIQTISGGQKFQAALSLSLSLSESISNARQITTDFFFLDEGFGSLDNETLDTVFTTLREISLYGKKIGVISHVDRLKEQMPVFLNVEFDKSEGSRVSLVCS